MSQTGKNRTRKRSSGSAASRGGAARHAASKRRRPSKRQVAPAPRAAAGESRRTGLVALGVLLAVAAVVAAIVLVPRMQTQTQNAAAQGGDAAVTSGTVQTTKADEGKDSSKDGASATEQDKATESDDGKAAETNKDTAAEAEKAKTGNAAKAEDGSDAAAKPEDEQKAEDKAESADGDQGTTEGKEEAKDSEDTAEATSGKKASKESDEKDTSTWIQGEACASEVAGTGTTTASGIAFDDSQPQIGIDTRSNPASHFGDYVEIRYGDLTVTAQLVDCGAYHGGTTGILINPGVYTQLGFSTADDWGRRNVEYRFLG